MSKNQRSLILIYGATPALLYLEQTLRADPSLRVIQIDPDGPRAGQQVAALGEGVLLYDPATADPELIAAIHLLHPRMPTVGVGGRDGQGLALQGQMLAPAVAQGLAQTLAAASMGNP